MIATIRGSSSSLPRLPSTWWHFAILLMTARASWGEFSYVCRTLTPVKISLSKGR
jgi:hypothetical protein